MESPWGPEVATPDPDRVVLCSRCVMDTTDPDIQFDSRGMCNHCRRYDGWVRDQVFVGDAGRRKLAALVAQIKQDGAGREYDCLIGLSGGVDSSYVAYQVKELGLRPLAVHLDNGWDSELAVKNIECMVRSLRIDLQTHVIDWEEFKDLQVAFLRASTPDCEIPTDHAISALMFRAAKRIGVDYVVSGDNVRTESHLPPAWSQGHRDWGYIKGVHRRFGRRPLRTFPHIGLRNYLLGLPGRMVQVNILNYLDYVKRDAVSLLERTFGWKSYGGKHHESIYTRFYQGYILRRKFGYDKRKSHLSSLICSGEVTREQALAELKEEPYPLELQEQDREYVIKKLGLTAQEFQTIMELPRKSHWNYPSYAKLRRSPLFQAVRSLYRFVKNCGVPAAREGSKWR